ncbi:hypothetical protein MHB65_20095 [Lysinibacillus sp. FSL K6-0075]|uniref:hypothetical protein n=1 Tax=Lysinibacillus sp. FSL K6-0075 TaxID=2921415 RepID=UPI003158A414
MALHEFTRNELDTILKKVVNKTLGQVDVNNVFARTITHPKITGIAGDVVEQSILGYLLCIIFEEPSPKAQLQLQ